MRVNMNGLTITYTSSLSKARDLADHYENQGFQVEVKIENTMCDQYVFLVIAKK